MLHEICLPLVERTLCPAVVANQSSNGCVEGPIIVFKYRIFRPPETWVLAATVSISAFVLHENASRVTTNSLWIRPSRFYRYSTLPMRKLRSLPAREAAFIEPMKCLAVAKLPAAGSAHTRSSWTATGLYVRMITDFGMHTAARTCGV
jgi:hypothetical protein